MIAVRGDAAEVALGEAQAVLALVQDGERRGRLADLVAAVQEGELGDDEAQALEELIELGLSSGRIRSVYGPEGEQAALKTFRRLPGGRALAESAGEVTRGAARARGQDARAGARCSRPAPASFLVTLAVDGLELSRPARPRRRARPLGRRLSGRALRRLSRPRGPRAASSSATVAMAQEKVDGLRAAAPTSRSSRRAITAPTTLDGDVARRRGDERRRAEPAHLRRRRRAQRLLQRRRRARALLVHPAGAAPARPDHGRRLDRQAHRRRSRSGCATRFAVADRRRARAARRASCGASGRG